MTHSVAFAQKSSAPTEPFEVGVVQWLRRPEDAQGEVLACGLWTVTPVDAPEPMDIDAPGGETIFIESGRIRIEVEGGDTLDLTAGSMASLPKGTKTRWTVLEPTVEFFVYS